MRSLLRFATALLAAAVSLGTVIASAEPATSVSDWPAHAAWAPRFQGVDYFAVTLTKPRLLRMHVMRVDLSAEGIDVCTDRDNGPRPEETDGCYTTTFLSERGCQLAINGAPFWPGQAAEGGPQNVVGLVVEDGVLVSPVDKTPARDALVFRGDRAGVETPPIDLAGVQTALGGFGVVLRGGEIFRDELTPPDVLDGAHPRTAIGVADGGRTLLLVVIDGRQPGHSEGVTLRELGELFRLLGADDALNLDGGGTTAMAIEGADGEPVLVNQPINGGVVGRQRVSASHLGVHARPLPKGPP